MKEKKHCSFRHLFLAIALSIMTVLVLMPVSVHAEDVVNEEIPEADLQTTEIVLPAPQNLKVTVEGYDVKVNFEMPDNEYQSNIYYRIQCDKNGNWDNPDYMHFSYFGT